MSGYGKQMLGNQRSGSAANGVAAGTKQVAKQGEANMDQIWPSDKGRRAEINGRGNLITDDINRNVYNPRM